MNTAKGVHDLTYRIKSEAPLSSLFFDPQAHPMHDDRPPLITGHVNFLMSLNTA